MMTDQTLIVHSAVPPHPDYVVTASGQRLRIPADWACLKPGDAAITRTLKTLGPSWTAVHQQGGKTFADGVWAPRLNIEAAKTIVARKRAEPAYAQKLATARQRRARQQLAYELSFQQALLEWLDFHPCYHQLAAQLAEAIARHATPIGSGTVARTARIPLAARAGAAAIAWLRHRTTAYESMKIAQVKGRRREVRRQLARQSVLLLQPYRTGQAVKQASCPLTAALRQTATGPA